MVLGSKRDNDGDRPLCTFDPSECLTFRFEPRKHIPTTVTMKNTSSKRVAFKVKTTNPKKYSVRPSSGILDGNSTKDIVVTLNAQKGDATFIQNCRDKFLIQTTQVDRSVKAVSSELFETSNSLQQHKLRVQMIPVNPVSPVAEGMEETMHTPMGQSGSAVPASGGKGVTFAMDGPVAGPRVGSTTTRVGSSRGFGMLHLVLVTLLAFALGYFFRGEVPVLEWARDVVEKRVSVVLGLAPAQQARWFG
jgi:hypothetical protein